VLKHSLRAKALRTSFARSLAFAIGVSYYRMFVALTYSIVYLHRSLTYSLCSYCSLALLYLLSIHLNALIALRSYLTFVALMLETSVHTQSRVCVMNGPKGPSCVCVMNGPKGPSCVEQSSYNTPREKPFQTKNWLS
jgi:hypothetical protein